MNSLQSIVATENEEQEFAYGSLECFAENENWVLEAVSDWQKKLLGNGGNNSFFCQPGCYVFCPFGTFKGSMHIQNQ